MPNTYSLLCYTREATGREEANNEDIAYSMHLALRLGDDDGARWRPLNENYGIFFAAGVPIAAVPEESRRACTAAAQYAADPYEAPQPASEAVGYGAVMPGVDITLKSLKDPFLFRLADGRFGIAATRTDRGGAPDGSDFCRSLSVIRSRDIRVMLAVQSLGQLQNRYPNNLWSEIIGNCDIQLMLGCTDDVTADYISDRSGEMCIVVDSTMTVKKTVAVTQVIPQYRETQGQGKRKLLTPDEVLRLPHEQMLVIIRGQNLLLLNKFDYTRHPMSKEMVRASIMDYCPRTSYAPTPQTGSENEPDKKPQRESRGRKLSRSDTPPVEF